MNNNIQSVFAECLLKTNLSEKRKSILRAGLAIFSTRGFSSTTIMDISRMTGIEEKEILVQFKDKDQILKSIMNLIFEFVVPKLEHDFIALIENQKFDDLSEFLHFIIKNRIIFALQNEGQILILIQESLKYKSVMDKINRHLFFISSSKVAHQIKYFQSINEIINIPVQRVIQYIFSIVSGFIFQIVITRRSNVSNKQINIWVDEATKILVRGLSPKSNNYQGGSLH
ncbi:TetR/AcrR family transcriptional regulator [Fructilactobacillus frigidiflavus]|uniref:TetR/AcrR family transcriptional regulator n=1 Tax=Fructilactobacillus frigidiflavus TaxID=3242688 RepID=UPI003758449E